MDAPSTTPSSSNNTTEKIYNDLNACLKVCRDQYRGSLSRSPAPKEERTDRIQSNHGKIQFPEKLHGALEYADKNGKNKIISWMPSRDGFKIHDKKTFIKETMR